jgi:hypothetical protein
MGMICLQLRKISLLYPAIPAIPIEMLLAGGADQLGTGKKNG